MDAEQAQQFLDDCNEIFGFAVRDYGFRPGELEHDKRLYRLRVFFSGQTIGLQLEFDYFDRYVGLDIWRLKDGRRLEPGEDGTDRPVRGSLGDILQRRRRWRVRDMTKELGGPRSKSKERKWLEALDDGVFWRWWLKTDAEDLRDLAEDVLRNETTCFDELAQPLFPKPSKRPKLP